MKWVSHFFSYDFLWYINRISIETADYVFLGIAVVLVLVAFVFGVLGFRESESLRKDLLQRFWKNFLTIGLLGVLWYGARIQFIGLFGTRLAFLILLLAGLIWFGYLIRYVRSEYALAISAATRQRQKDKYLKMS